MNKKLSIIMLGAYLSTTLVPSIAFAEQTNVILSEDEISKEGLDEKIDEENNLSKVTISYVDEKGTKLADDETTDTLFAKDELKYPNGIHLASVPETINGLKPVSLKVNGVVCTELPRSVSYGLKGGMDDLTIEWVYGTVGSQAQTTSVDLFHKSFFFDDKLLLDGNGIIYALPTNVGPNFKLTQEILNHLKNSTSSKNFASISCTAYSSNLNTEYPWLENVTKMPSYIKGANLTSENKSFKTPLYIYDDIYSTTSKNDYDKIYVYTVDEQNKKITLSGELNYLSSNKVDDKYAHSYHGEIKDALNTTIIYMSEKLNLDTEKPDTEKPDTEKPDTEKPDNEKPDTNGSIKGPFGNYDKFGFGKFTIDRASLDGLSDNVFVHINGIDAPEGNEKTYHYISIGYKNLKSAFDKIKETENITIDASSKLTGLSKKFNDSIKTIVDKVTIESNVSLNGGEVDNNVSFQNMNDSNKTYHVYSAPLSNTGKIEYLGKVDENKSISTKSEIQNKTLFVTTEEIKLNADGSLPDTSGIPTSVFVIGSLTLASLGGYLVLGKRKK